MAPNAKTMFVELHSLLADSLGVYNDEKITDDSNILSRSADVDLWDFEDDDE